MVGFDDGDMQLMQVQTDDDGINMTRRVCGLDTQMPNGPTNGRKAIGHSEPWRLGAKLAGHGHLLHLRGAPKSTETSNLKARALFWEFCGKSRNPLLLHLSCPCPYA